MSIQLLSQAIEDRVVVLFHHEGRQYAVEPYSLGYNKPLAETAGPLVLRGWCLSANTWRDFKVKHMSRLDVSNNRFTGDRLGHIDLLWVHRDIWGRRDSQRSN